MTQHKIFVPWAYCLNFAVKGQFCSGSGLCDHCYFLLMNVRNPRETRPQV
jgi:hypothetical protein